VNCFSPINKINKIPLLGANNHLPIDPMNNNPIVGTKYDLPLRIINLQQMNDLKKNAGMGKRYLFILVAFSMFLSLCAGTYQQPAKATCKTEKPHIVNIINFIRLCEPRDTNITEEVLYETVVKQVEIMKKNKLGGTFLLQYDALLDPRYQKLLKSLPHDSFEIGAWWEIPQPLVENAGLKWGGHSSWDPHADVDFSIGYALGEREKLVDTYMRDFKKIFGYYPKSVGSWFIDAHTLNYMYQKYGIVASCNCKDQAATDGYTMWGGYWNQAYYPSLKNAYMPAQDKKNQISVPVFRMLGSDPIHQYDSGLGSNGQGVVTLESAYKYGGGDSAWVNWYFKEFIGGKCMEYAYVQAGQENSFTWGAMAKGFEIQMPLIARLRDEKKLKVETLAESGQWFRAHNDITPATSLTVDRDVDGSNRETVWFDSRFYRINLLWEDGTLRFRDIHMFDENFPSDYITKRDTSNTFSFFTLPFVDGNFWSSPDKTAGLRVKGMVNGKEISMEGEDPVIRDSIPGKLHISWTLKSFADTLVIDIDERQIAMKVKGKEAINWFLDLTTAADADLPFKRIAPTRIDCQFKGMNYFITTARGSFSTPGDGVVFRITPDKNTLILNLSQPKFIKQKK
jgi:hypothetical protein